MKLTQLTKYQTPDTVISTIIGEKEVPVSYQEWLEQELKRLQETTDRYFEIRENGKEELALFGERSKKHVTIFDSYKKLSNLPRIRIIQREKDKCRLKRQ